MPTFSEIQITRDSLDAFEGATLEKHSAETDLGLSDKDSLMATQAQIEAKLDLFDRTDRYYHNGDYDSMDNWLNELADTDEDGLILRLMSFKFLEMFFADNAIGSSDELSQKSIFYENKYNTELPKIVSELTSRMDEPKIQNRPRFVR